MKTRIAKSETMTALAVVTLGMLLASTAHACGSQEQKGGLLSSRLLTAGIASLKPSTIDDLASAQDAATVSIVGLWNVTLFAGNSSDVYDELLEQWHSDGTELANDTAVSPSLENICLGVWKQTGPRTVKLRHIGWNFNSDGTFAGTFLLVAGITLDAGGNTYTGTYTADSFDTAGKVIADLHAEGLLKGTRFEVDPSSSGAGAAGVTIVVTGSGASASANSFDVVLNQITLDASTSTSTNAGGLTFFWTSAQGYPNAAILGSSTATPLIQLPTKGVYQFTLTVTDAAGFTASTAITVRHT